MDGMSIGTASIKEKAKIAQRRKGKGIPMLLLHPATTYTGVLYPRAEIWSRILCYFFMFFYVSHLSPGEGQE